MSSTRALLATWSKVLSPKDFERYKAQLEAEQVAAKRHLDCIVAAYLEGDWEAFYRAATCDGVDWPALFRRLKKLPPPSEDIMRAAFETVWQCTKHMPLYVGNHRLVVDVARKMFLPYSGPARRLWRGGSSREHRRRAYSLSWTASRSVAEDFARQYEGVILETLAPPEAIIHEMRYPEPATAEERAAYPPDVQFDDFSKEQEFLVDRRFLTRVVSHPAG
jgi:hypothetical protein